MKFILALVAILAVFGLGQTHQVPNFGKGALHEDIQDILDLIPMGEIAEIFLDYLKEDAEVKIAAGILAKTTILKDMITDVQAIPEVRKLFDYLQGHGINIYYLMNMVNKILEINKVYPLNTYILARERTGGIAGFFKDVKRQFHYDDFIRIYVHKMKTSPAFFDFVQQLKSDNFQQIVNKVYAGKSFQMILRAMKASGVNLQIVADVLYVVLGITVPGSDNLQYAERTLDDDLLDFMMLIPMKKYIEIVLKYMLKDEEVRGAIEYMYTSEFHDLLRNVEALEETKAVVKYVQKAGFNIIEAIKQIHRAIGMEDYVPPTIENTFESEIGVQGKVYGGMRAMFDELMAIMPVEQFQALYEEKMKTSKVFADFVAKMKAPEHQKLTKALLENATFQKFVAKSKEAGLDFIALMKFNKKLFPWLFPDSIFLQ